MRVQLPRPEGWPPPLAGAAPVSSVLIPDTEAARAAEALCRDASSWALYAHAARSFLFGSLIARRRHVSVDAEALYVGCVLHDLGLTPAYEDAVRPFEEVGADIAVDLVASLGWTEERRENVRRAIVMHMAVGIADAESPETRMLEAGVACDVTGDGLDVLDGSDVEAVLQRLPRGTFKRDFTPLMVREAERKPCSAAAQLARLGLIGQLERAPFKDSTLVLDA
jgi:hypothetical protein